MKILKMKLFKKKFEVFKLSISVGLILTFEHANCVSFLCQSLVLVLGTFKNVLTSPGIRSNTDFWLV
jgi:hypothetical protein